MNEERHSQAAGRRSDEFPDERPNEFWRKVYLAVVATTFVVVTALWGFSQYFK